MKLTIYNYICFFVFGYILLDVVTTLISFIVLVYYSMGLQMHGIADFMSQYAQTGDLYGKIRS